MLDVKIVSILLFSWIRKVTDLIDVVLLISKVITGTTCVLLFRFWPNIKEFMNVEPYRVIKIKEGE